jgi:hypothetical protein
MTGRDYLNSRNSILISSGLKRCAVDYKITVPHKVRDHIQKIRATTEFNIVTPLQQSFHFQSISIFGFLTKSFDHTYIRAQFYNKSLAGKKYKLYSHSLAPTDNDDFIRVFY